MEILHSILRANVLNEDYYIVFSVLIAVWVYNLWQDKQYSLVSHGAIAFLSLLNLFISRSLCVAIRTGEIPGSAFWTDLAMFFNLLWIFFSTLFVIKVLKETTDENTGLKEAEEKPPARNEFLYLLRCSVIAAMVGGGAYAALAFAEVVQFSWEIFSILAGFSAGVAINIAWVPVVKEKHFYVKGAVILSSVLLVAAWITFHMLASLRFYYSPVFLGISRFLDLGYVVSILVGFQKGRTAERLRYQKYATNTNEQMQQAKKELNRLHKLTTQIFEDNSEMVKKLKSQTKILVKKTETLEKVLDMALSIQKKRELKELLQMIVEMVKENLGFNTVILRLLIEKTQSFESKAFVGLSEEARDTVENYRIPKSEFEKMIEPHYRISRSYFIRNSTPWYGESLEGGETILVDNAWKEIDMLIIPLIDAQEKTIGYLSVEDPKDVQAPLADVIETLESIASLAVEAIQNAKMLKELEDNNEKLKVYTEKLEELNKMKSDFVATISHEFKTPLTSIRAYCETLMKNADQLDRKIIKEFLEVIDEESGRLMDLINDILNFSQLESGAIKFERSLCNLNDVINEVVDDLRDKFDAKSIRLNLELPSRGVLVRADRDMMKQLIENILDNASKFTGEEGNVKVRLEEEVVSVKIIVEDDGIGIPEDQMEKIFEHFHQVDNSSTRKYGGSGLGLALCKSIVDWHDGRIWVENVEGGGARFVMVVPKKQAVVRNQLAKVSGPVRRFEVERYLELLIEMVAEFLLVKRASLMLFDMSKSELKIQSAIGIDEEVVENARVKVGDSISGRVVQEGETYLVEDIEQDPRTGRSNNSFVYESKSFLSVPIKIEGEVVGVVNVANPINKHKFDQEDKNLLELFVERISHALQKLEEFTNVSEDFEKIRNTLKSILDAKRYIDVQSDLDLSKLVLKTANRLGLDEEEKATLQYALNIYDVGLAEVGCNIIYKPNELTPEDRDKIESHTIAGIEAIKAIEAMPKVKDIVLYHHENFDGTGYPGRLSETSIPIGARIIRVLDSFKALTSRRPYQKQYSLDEAVEVLRHRSGSFFDPEVVEAFIEAIEERRRELECERKERLGKKNKAEDSKVEVTCSKEDTNAQGEDSGS